MQLPPACPHFRAGGRLSTHPVTASMIVAAARNGTIGRDNALPWRIADDLRYFRRITMGKPVIMGRRTFDSIGRPLPGRDNIVVSRNPEFAAAGVRVAQGVEEAFTLAAASARSSGAGELLLLGGAQLYAEAMGKIQRIYLTRVHADIAGDSHLPSLDDREWREISREDYPADSRNDFPYSFIVLERK